MASPAQRDNKSWMSFSLSFLSMLNGIIPLGNWVRAYCPRQGWLVLCFVWGRVNGVKSVKSVSQSVSQSGTGRWRRGKGTWNASPTLDLRVFFGVVDHSIWVPSFAIIGKRLCSALVSDYESLTRRQEVYRYRALVYLRSKV